MRKTKFPYQSSGVTQGRKEVITPMTEENITIEELFENIQEAYERACDGCEETECFSLDRCLKPDVDGDEYCEHEARKYFYADSRNADLVRGLFYSLGLVNFELKEADEKKLEPEDVKYAHELFGPGPLHAFDILMSALSLGSVADIVYEVLEKACDLQSISDYEEKKANGALEVRSIEELWKELDL